MVFYGLWELVLLLVFGLGLAIPSPFGLPPQPEDPALLRAAPADTVFYLQWFGHAQPDPNSRNATEQLATEPEVVAFVQRLRLAIRASVLRDEEEQELASNVLDLVETALENPCCLFVSAKGLDRGEPGMGLVLRLGDEVKRAELVMRRLETLLADELQHEHAASGQITLDGVTFRPLADAGTQTLRWGIFGEYFVLVAGDDATAAIVRGLKGEPGLGAHPEFARLHGAVRVARPCFRSFVDLDRIAQIASEQAGEELASALDLMGFDHARAVFSETGLEGTGYTSRTMLGTAGEPKGLMKLMSAKPLTDGDLAVVPGDATYAAVGRFDPRDAYRLLREMLNGFEPRLLGDLDRGIGQIEMVLGVRFETDLLAHLGDVVSVWSSPSQGSLLFTGTTAALSLADGEAFGKVYEKIMARIKEITPRKERQENGRFRRGFYVESTRHQDHEVYFVNMVGDDFPIAPAWCATDTHLYFSFFPQTLKAALDRGLDQPSSLAQHKPLAESRGSLAVTRLDAERALQTIYPLLHPLAHLAAAELQRNGFDIDISALPTQASILRHLRAETSVLERTDNGLLLTRHGVIPVGDPVLGLTLPFALWTGTYVRLMMLRAHK